MKLKILKNKKIIISILLLIIGSLTINHTFFKPTKINLYIASKLYKTPANTAFTDDNFYKCVVDTYNKKNNTNKAYTNNLTDEELETITSLKCISKDIVNTDGLEKLTALTELYLDSNQLTSLCISNNHVLEKLDVENNQLKSLDVTNNQALKSLNVGYNQLTNIDIRNNTVLKKIYLSDNELTLLDVSNNSELTQIVVDRNNLTSLDVSNNPILEGLNVSLNQLTNLGVTNNPVLDYLNVAYNQLTTIDLSQNIALTDLKVSNNQLTTLDVATNPELEFLDVSGNQLINLNVSHNQKLKQLYVYNTIYDDYQNQLTSLDVSHNPSLKHLYAYHNQLTTIDLSQNIALTDLRVSNNQLTTLDVVNNPELELLDVSFNQITSLNISSTHVLKEIKLSYNQLTDLDVGNSSVLERLLVDNNQLVTLDASNNPKLNYIYAVGNKLTTLDVSNTPLLKKLVAYNNKLTSLDLTSSHNLEELEVHSNALTNLDLSNNSMLMELDVSNNKLANLDLSNNSKLKNINAAMNELTALKVSNIPDLEKLYVSDNQLTSLDVSNNLQLTKLNVIANSLKNLDLSKNNKLSDLSISSNPYSESIVLYKGNNIQLGNNVKLPSHIEITNNWKSQDNNITTVDNNGIATAINTGRVIITNNNSKYSTTSTLNIIEITSDKYVINNDKNYIYIGTALINENIIGNFNIPEDINLTITPDNKLQVKYNEDILKEFTLINVSSDVYDLTKNYIYVGTETIDLTKINITNATIIEEDNQLKVKYNDETVHSIAISKIYSQSYVFFKNNIFIGNEQLDIEKINIINGTVINEDEKLKVKYNNATIYEYNILSVDFNDLSVKGNSIIITEDISYEDFTSNITPNGVTYKIYDGEDEVTEGTITKDMVLKIYKDDEKIYEYQITDEFLDLTLLTIDEEESLIKNLKLGTTISSFKENILTSGRVKILDQDGEELKGSDLVRSGAKVVIELSKDKYEYTLSVKGDVTGTGTSTVSDVGKLYQYLRKKIPMEKCYIEAGNVTDTDNEIKITDVGKLYQFIKGKIDSLEG